MELEDQRKNCCKKCKHFYYNGVDFACREINKEIIYDDDEFFNCPKTYWENFTIAKKDIYDQK